MNNSALLPMITQTMIVKSKLTVMIISAVMFFASCTHSNIMVDKEKMTDDGIVRLSKIEVYPQYLDEYLQFAVEVGTKSLQSEPGVLTMYAMQDKDNPCVITILETYSSQEAYKAHIASGHFQRYKQGTLHMVKKLELCDQTPLNPDNIITNTIAS